MFLSRLPFYNSATQLTVAVSVLEACTRYEAADIPADLVERVDTLLLAPSSERDPKKTKGSLALNTQ